MSENSRLREQIERLFAQPAERVDKTAARDAIALLKAALNRGEIRSAENDGGTWRVNTWVKMGILLAFRTGGTRPWGENGTFPFFDKDTMAVKNIRMEDGVRIVPGGSAIRDGAYVAPGVVMMPPSYVNIGAYVDTQTMIDSHALVGSCAQIGRRVHLSAAAQIGGVLEPIGSLPVIIEDDVFIGGNCGIYEGTIVRRGAVIAAGVLLTGSTPVYDLVRGAVYRKSEEGTLQIPANAVVVPGSRTVDHPFARQHGLALSAPVIVKYRDGRTDAATVLEESLR